MPLDLQQLHDAVITGDNKVSHSITEQALEEGIDPLSLVNEYMMPAMDEVGRRFETNEYYVPELLLSARAMKASLGLIRPLLTACDVEPLGRVISGTVKGDLHDIGKTIVGNIMAANGFDVHDLGTDVSPDRFIEAAEQNNADIIGLSALMTTTMPVQRDLVEFLDAVALRDRFIVMVGGAPTTVEWVEKISADGWGGDAYQACARAIELVDAKKKAASA